jgi:hypothetical protein
MDDLPNIRAKIKAHFSNNYQRHLFTLSMGEGNPAAITMKSLCNFLAQSVTLLGYLDPAYLQQMVEVHQRLGKMCEDMLAKDDQGSVYYCGLMAGTMIEMAAEAIREIDA